MVAYPSIRKFPFPARPRSPSIKAFPKAELKRWPSPRENAVQRSRSPISGITPATSALAWAAPNKTKLATIGKNDFGEIESMPLPCREIAAGSAPQAVGLFYFVGQAFPLAERWQARMPALQFIGGKPPPVSARIVAA